MLTRALRNLPRRRQGGGCCAAASIPLAARRSGSSDSSSGLPSAGGGSRLEWFAPSNPTLSSTPPPPTPAACDKDEHKPPSKRTLNLGRTLRVLQERMPTLLHSPLPTQILSPRITLHLFPSTHPHLPAVRGRVAYIAALWTSPVAWGRIPGRSPKLQVMSERMVEEVYIVRWKTMDSGEKEFCGIFLFEFDDEGRVERHTIEEADRGVEGRVGGVVGVTEWLLGKARGAGGGTGGGGGLAWQFERLRDGGKQGGGTGGYR